MKLTSDGKAGAMHMPSLEELANARVFQELAKNGIRPDDIESMEYDSAKSSLVFRLKKRRKGEV